MGGSLRSPAEVEGNEAFPPQTQKDLASPLRIPWIHQGWTPADPLLPSAVGTAPRAQVVRGDTTS